GFLTKGRIEAQTKLRSARAAAAKTKERIGEMAGGHAAYLPSSGETHFWSAHCGGLIGACLIDHELQCPAATDSCPRSFCRGDLKALPGGRTGRIRCGLQPAVWRKRA